MAEALDGIKIDGFKNCSEQWKKQLNRCIASNGEYFEGDWSLNVKEKVHNFLINKSCFGGPPSYTCQHSIKIYEEKTDRI